MARKASIRLVQEAFERSGRADPKLVMGAIEELSWADAHATPREAATLAITSRGLRVVEGSDPIEIRPTGRDPALVGALSTLDAEVEAMRVRKQAIAQERDALVRKAVAARLAEEGREVPECIDTRGSHDCDGSPSGFCCYDPDEDPALDDCLFCHGPDERK